MSSENNVKSKDLALVNDLNAALQKEKHSGQFWVIMLFFIFLVVFVIWAYNSPIEEVTRGQGNVIPSSREQVVQSIDPGIIMEMKVKEGEIVEKDQILLKLDDTRSSAIWRESEAKVQNLEAMVARLKAEAYGTELSFPKGISNELKQREHAAFVARRRAVVDAIQGLSISKATLDKEISITAPMVAQGVVSEVELLRMQRESSDLALQIAERRNRYMADANNELVQAESELAQAKENMAMRADPVDRSLIRAPMRGIVKNIEINTVGGVVNVGQDILTIVPLDDKLLVEAYIRPQDVAFMSPGLPAVVKISAYGYAIYGGLDGKVTLISPDTMSNNNQPRANDLKLDPNQVYYRILVQTDSNSLKDKNGKDMPIIPGMVATVDVKTGEKTVFQYLIKPITRMKQALREAAAQPAARWDSMLGPEREALANALGLPPVIARNLPRAVANGDDLEARTRVAFGNTLSGVVMCLSATTSQHSMEHAMSAYHQDLPHGAGLIMLSRAYFSFFIDRHVCDERFVRMARAMGMEQAAQPGDFITALTRLQQACGVADLRMSDYGITPEEFPKFVSNARSTMGILFKLDRLQLSDEDLVKIYTESYR